MTDLRNDPGLTFDTGPRRPKHQCLPEQAPQNVFSGTRVVALRDWQCPECGARWRHHWDTDNEGNPTVPPDEWWTRIPELPHG